MTPANPDFRAATLHAMAHQPFAVHLGITVVSVEPGRLTTSIVIQPFHLQHDGIVHGGVHATLADLGVAMAAHTLIAADEQVVTIEFKINYLRAARGGQLICRAEVVRPGRTISVTEATITERSGAEERVIAKALGTVAILRN